MPGTSVTFHVALPRVLTPVLTFTPGPLRWKLSFTLRSVTVIVAGPGSVGLGFSEIVFFGPTAAAAVVGGTFPPRK